MLDLLNVGWILTGTITLPLSKLLTYLPLIKILLRLTCPLRSSLRVGTLLRGVPSVSCFTHYFTYFCLSVT